MKVYIKPWEEALKCARETNKNFIDTVDGINYIVALSYQSGDWGHIVEAKKDNDNKFYTSYCGKEESFAYPTCCVEEITPEWLEEHALVFIEDIIPTNNTANTQDYYTTYRITIYKTTDALHDYFFYVNRVSYNGKVVDEDFIEIK